MSASSQTGGRTVGLGPVRPGERLDPMLLEIMEEGVLVHASDGSVAGCNAAAEHILGIPAGRLVGSLGIFPDRQAMLEDGTPFCLEDEPARIALLTGEPCRAHTLRFRRPNGEAAWLRLSAAPLPPRTAGGHGGALTVLLDITEQKALERQLRGAHRMEAIGRLAGGVAHDFNNLLTAILGYNEFLLRGLGASDPLRREAQQVRQAAQRAAGLTRQLLMFSRRQALEPRVLDLNAVLTEMQPILRQLIGEHVHLSVETGSGLAAVRADRTQLEQVVLNLAMNARDATVTGGQIRIATASTHLDQVFEDTHPGSRAGRFVVLSVEDDGCGMDAETQAQIFEPFFTTKSHDKGTGLGLATVYGIVKRGGGYIDVDSVPGRGSTFRVYLPCCDEVAQPVPAPPRHAPPPRTSGTILLVEDDDQVRALARRILEEQGFTVLEERDGLRALAALERHTGPIDALVTDVVMPGLGGPELAWRAAERHPEMQVLYISGYMDTAFASHGRSVRGTHFLPKPFEAEALAGKLREILAMPIPDGNEDPDASGLERQEREAGPGATSHETR